MGLANQPDMSIGLSVMSAAEQGLPRLCQSDSACAVWAGPPHRESQAKMEPGHV